jgi:hypothetical protein
VTNDQPFRSHDENLSEVSAIALNFFPILGCTDNRLKRGDIAIFNNAARDECAMVNNAQNKDTVRVGVSNAHQTS